jgi:hypothetical protein
MESKFNSLFDNEDTIDVELNNYYDVTSLDNVNLDTRIINNPLILNFSDEELEKNKLLNERRYGSLPVTIISGRPCATSLCTSNKFCESSGNPEILFEPPLTCKNDFSPQGQKGNNKRYIENIDIEARLFNMDYKATNKHCGKKDFKDKNISALNCFKDSVLLGDKVDFNYATKSYKHNPKKNSACKLTYDRPLFNNSSKRIDTVDW